MRIVAGRFKGTALAAPKDQSTRPTTDRNREALFNVLAHGLPDFDGVNGVRVLDLFAGTGALGLEALSRGASHALFVEESASARALIRQNIEKTRSMGIAKIFRRDATRLGDIGRIEPFDLVFVDPPYGKGLGEKALFSAAKGGWLNDGAIAVLEEQSDSEISEMENYEELDQRHYGETQFVLLRFTEN